jgi:Kef-type K+ transport system membrane component KefB
VNALASLGLILLIALTAGHLVKFLKIPEVTGYILAGILVGPSVLGWLTHENVETLTVFSHVALGLILFSVGSVFEKERVLKVGPAVARVTLLESFAAGGLVAVLAAVLGQPWQTSLLLGAIAMETAAASTLMVIRECHADGPLSETLRGIIAINNIVCLITFYLVASLVDLSVKMNSGENILWSLYASLFPLPWQVIGSAALGYLVGLLIASWAPKVHEHGEMLILLTGCILLCVGASLALELSPLISSLAVGATMVNLSGQSRRLFQALSRSDPNF